MPTHVYFSGGPSIIVEEDFDQVQQRLEHEAGLFTLNTGAETGHRVSIHRSAVAYIEEILRGEQRSPRGVTLPPRDGALLRLNPDTEEPEGRYARPRRSQVLRDSGHANCARS
jgi:hypothetical protein